jgi:hypothetical protein
VKAVKNLMISRRRRSSKQPRNEVSFRSELMNQASGSGETLKNSNQSKSKTSAVTMKFHCCISSKEFP